MYELFAIDTGGKLNYGLVRIMQGTRSECAHMMNYKRHYPNSKEESTRRYALYDPRGKLVSSTLSGGGLNAGGK